MVGKSLESAVSTAGFKILISNWVGLIANYRRVPGVGLLHVNWQPNVRP